MNPREALDLHTCQNQEKIDHDTKMAKMSLTRMARKYDWEKDRGRFRRDTPIPATPRKHAGDCIHCGEPVMVSPGQSVTVNINKDGDKLFSHKACRKAQKK